jgi:hypothetical protein
VEEQEYLCCCVLIHGGDVDDPIPCMGDTTGPDDPFCGACSGRHWDLDTVKSGFTVVTAQLRRQP